MKTSHCKAMHYLAEIFHKGKFFKREKRYSLILLASESPIHTCTNSRRSELVNGNSLPNSAIIDLPYLN